MDIDARPSGSRMQGTLITPSASPPSPRSFFPQPYRIADQPSPTKRPRLASTPRQTSSKDETPAPSSSADPFDFHQAREDSTMRLLSIWSNLERYVKPLDEDDIVDISTGKLIKDRGVLRNSQRWDVGCFANKMGVGQEEEEEGDNEDEDEDDVDELDAFAEEGVQELGVDINSRNVPPVRMRNPEDARDLDKFLEAERRRKEEYGSEPEDSIHDFRREESLEPEPSCRIVHSNGQRNKQQRVMRSPTPDDSGPTHPTPVYKRAALPRDDEDSTDELDNWDLDEASMVYQVTKDEEPESSDSEIEFIETPAFRPVIPKPALSKSTAAHTTKNQKLPKTIVQQLQTPPRSQASTTLSSSPLFEDVVELPPPSSSPIRSSSPVPTYDYDSSPIRPSVAEKQWEIPNQHKPSTSNGPHIDLKMKASNTARPVPPKSSKQRRSWPSPSPDPTRQAKPAARTSSTIPREKSIPVGRSKTQVEVVITSRPPPGVSRVSVPPEPIRKAPSISKGKGKQKAVEESEVEDSEDERVGSRAPRETTPPSPAKAAPKTKTTRSRTPAAKPKSKVEKAMTIAESSRSVAERKPPSGKSPKYGELSDKTTSGVKRKRITSTAEPEPEEAPRAHSPTKPKAAGRKQNASTSGNDEDSKPHEANNKIGNVKASRSKSKPKQLSRSRRSPSPEASSDNDRERRLSRAPSQHPHPHHGDPQYHPYPQMVYPPHPSGSHQHSYPVPDPRAQYIISNAMHQLSALVSGWPTPGATHDNSGRASTPFMPPPYLYPGTPNGFFGTPTHHSHPYPYPYDPNFSRATTPPDSPDTPSTSMSGSRRKALVPRSRSKGRNVSFQGYEHSFEDGDDEHAESASSAPQTPEPRKARTKPKTRARSVSEERGNSSKTTGRGKSSSRRAKSVSDSGSEPEQEPAPRSRGRKLNRSQTPAPPSRGTSTESAEVAQKTSRSPSKRGVQAQKRR